MDAIDKQLLRALQENARMSIVQLSKRLKKPRGTVEYRLRRLERNGVIRGYTALLGPGMGSGGVRAWTSLAVRGSKTRAIIDRLLDVPSVTALYDTNGRWDLLLELQAPNSQQLAAILQRVLRIEGVQSSETSIHLDTLRRTPND